MSCITKEWFDKEVARIKEGRVSIPAFSSTGKTARLKRWTSHARWPLDVYKGADGSGVSTDTHHTQEEALNVCNVLNREGFGGQRKAFPLETWVTHE